jgi:hypothetical protein
MTFEDRVRRALHAEVEDVNVDAQAWERVQAEVSRRRHTWMGPRLVVPAIALAAAIAAALSLTALLASDGGQVVEVSPPVAGDPSSTAPTTTEAPLAGDEVVLFPGIWPFTSEEDVAAYEGDDFDTPQATALGFARDYLGMPDPQVADYVAGRDRRHRVSVTPRRDSPLVTQVDVFTRTSDGPYFVTGASTKNIEVDTPAPGDTVGRVVGVSGTSTAFEANVQVEVRQDGQTFGARLGSGFVMGGSMGEMAPFSGELAIDASTEPAGAAVFFTDSAEDGSVQEATVVRVAFDGAPTEFSVFFHRGDELVEVPREVPRTAAVLRAALESLFQGPQASDPEGLSSLFSADTAGFLNDVALESDGTAVVDLAGVVPNANTSAGSQAFLAALNATVFQFPTVQRIEYRLEGSCDAFWEWLQYGACRLVDRDTRT